MTRDEDLRRRELQLLEQAVSLLKQHVGNQAAAGRGLGRWATPASIVIGALTIVVTIVLSQQQVKTAQRQLDASSKQFELTLRQDQYADIVTGLASSSVGVQVNSIRRLTQYVRDPSNFEDEDARQNAAINTVQTLTAFIEDESTVPGHEGLTDYRDPQPVVVSRAVAQLKDLTEDEELSGISMDLSRGNFHGIELRDLEPTGAFLAVGADFRRATLTKWRLDGARADLSAAFFTCADLRETDFGQADVASADFTGADLRGVDLSDVANLTSGQLSGARVGDATRIPDGVERPPEPGWGVENDDDGGETLACRNLVDRMTNLVAGAGYSSRFPCPGESRSASAARVSRGERVAIRRVCKLRAGPG